MRIEDEEPATVVEPESAEYLGCTIQPKKKAKAAPKPKSPATIEQATVATPPEQATAAGSACSSDGSLDLQALLAEARNSVGVTPLATPAEAAE